jgi:hypothetical protein
MLALSFTKCNMRYDIFDKVMLAVFANSIDVYIFLCYNY